jgi:hypothetical protein
LRTGFITFLIGLSFSTCCFAWGTKEHILLTRLAAEGLIADPKTPEGMKNWLGKAAPDLRDIDGEKKFLLETRVGMFPRGADGLSFWAVVPDLNTAIDGRGDRAKIIEPFGVPEGSLHYIDLEYFFPIDAQRSYSDDLSHKPSFNDVPRDMADPRWKRSGMLPFRVEQCYKELVEQIGKGRLVDTPGQYPRDEHAQKWAGMLAHYAEDNTQPQHATADYMTQSYFRGLFRGPNVHADVEYRLVDDEQDDYTGLRREFWDELAKAVAEASDPIDTDDPWAATLQVSLLSYDALPLIGHAAVAAYSHDGEGWKFDAAAFYHFKGIYHGKEVTVMQMKADQMAWAVKRVQRLWRKAWDDAHARQR